MKRVCVLRAGLRTREPAAGTRHKMSSEQLFSMVAEDADLRTPCQLRNKQERIDVRDNRYLMAFDLICPPSRVLRRGCRAPAIEFRPQCLARTLRKALAQLRLVTLEVSVNPL